ncbi:MAG: hypothetical protein M3Q45_05870, partial [Chloroflexota bacterium]|nr:hypothetical protein [Chloroflexota bacterium]
MSDLVFDPQTIPTTSAAVMTQLLVKWSFLPPDVQEDVDTRRRQLARQLPAESVYQRTQSITLFLQWLESIPSVAIVAAPELQRGKALARRVLVSISDEQVHGLQAALEAPLPLVAALSAGVEIEFQVKVSVADSALPGAQTPLIVWLTRATPPPNQHAGSVVVSFADLQKPVTVQVMLTAPSFGEQTNDWTRTIQIPSQGSGAQDSLPAIFLLEAGTALGRTGLALHFYHTVGSAVHRVEIVPAIAKNVDAYRSAESRRLDQTIDYFTRIQFPAQLRPGEEAALIVQLTLQQMDSIVEQKVGVAFGDVRKPEQLEVVVTAPGFQERTGNWQRMITLYAHADSQPAVFLLVASDGLGVQPIMLDFYHKGRIVGSAAFTSEVTSAPIVPAVAPTPIPSAVQIAALPANPPPPADVQLRVFLNRQTNELQFELHSEIAELGYHHRMMGVTPLHQNPRQFLQGIFDRLNQFARRPVQDVASESRDLGPGLDAAKQAAAEKAPAATLEEIKTIGQGLFEQIFSPELQREYWQLKAWREAGKVRSLLIVSDEPWIPWELIKPFAFDSETNQALNDDYLAVGFVLARWLIGRGPAHAVEIKTAHLVAPTLDLMHTRREQEFFTNLQKRNIQVAQPLRTRQEVFAVTGQGDMNLLHLATHGSFDPANADASPIALQGGTRLRPSDLD